MRGRAEAENTPAGPKELVFIMVPVSPLPSKLPVYEGSWLSSRFAASKGQKRAPTKLVPRTLLIFEAEDQYRL
jgi:hypothetical protein